MKKILSLILALSLGALALAGCGASNESSAPTEAATQQDAAKLTFVLDWTPNTNHTGIYTALENGFYKEAGIDLTIVQPPEDGAEALVASGKAQFGVSFQDSMLAAIIGEDAMPIKAVAALVQHNTSGIISRKGEGIDTPKGLEGKKYATWDLPIEKATLKQVVEKDGGNFDKVELIPETIDDETAALKAKTVDAIWVFYGWAGVATEINGLETDYFAFKDIDPVFDYYTPVIVGNDNWMQENPELTKAFLSATRKGYEYAIDHPQEAADIMLKEAIPDADKKELVYKSQEYLSKEYKAEVEQWGYIDPARWNAFYNWINENNLASATVPENFGFTNEYLE